jgi:hypothetical protein
MRYLIFTILLLASAQGYCQYTYVPMPTDSAQWRCRQYIGASGGRYTTYDQLIYTTGADTVFNGVTYKQMFLRGHYWPVTVDATKPPLVPVNADAPDCFLGGMRESGKIVYFKGVEPQFNSCYGGDTSTFDFYNFNLTMGDSLNNSLNAGYLIGTQIAYIDTVTIDGTTRKRYHTVNETSTYPDYIEEGVGSIRGLQPYPSPYYYDNDLLCFSQHGTVLYSLNDSSCAAVILPWAPTNASSISNTRPEISISPNPFVHSFTIGGAEGYEIVLYNMIGQKIPVSITQTSSASLSVSAPQDLPAGIYNVMARASDGSNVWVRKIVKGL